jgi:hypothetical protein
VGNHRNGDLRAVEQQDGKANSPIRGAGGLASALAAARGRLDAAASVCGLMESVVDIIESTVSCNYVGLQTLSLPDHSAVNFAERQLDRCPISVSPARLRLFQRHEAASGGSDCRASCQQTEAIGPLTTADGSTACLVNRVPARRQYPT